MLRVRPTVSLGRSCTTEPHPSHRARLLLLEAQRGSLPPALNSREGGRSEGSAPDSLSPHRPGPLAALSLSRPGSCPAQEPLPGSGRIGPDPLSRRSRLRLPPGRDLSPTPSLHQLKEGASVPSAPPASGLPQPHPWPAPSGARGSRSVTSGGLGPLLSSQDSWLPHSPRNSGSLWDRLGGPGPGASLSVLPLLLF